MSTLGHSTIQSFVCFWHNVSKMMILDPNVISCLFGFYVAFKHLRSYHDGACFSSVTLTNVLLHRNAMPQTQDMTPHPVTVYRHGTDLSL